jgi:hypothetical protein
MRHKLHITSKLDGTENDSSNWRRHADGKREIKGRKTRHTETKTCVEILIAVRPSRCGGRARFTVSLQRQEPVLPTVWDGQISHLFRCKRLQNSLSLPLCQHPSSHSSFLTLVYSFHLHLYSNFCHVTFFIPHSLPTFPPCCILLVTTQIYAVLMNQWLKSLQKFYLKEFDWLT